MPELPEVETVRQGLKPLVGGVVHQVQVFHPRTIRKSTDLVEKLQNKKLSALHRRGKFLWFSLNSASKETINDVPIEVPQQALVIHLGMSGQLLLNSGYRHQHRRASLEIRQDEQEHTVNFIDQRTFGFLCISSLKQDLPVVLSHIAPDIVDNMINFESIIPRLRMRNSAIKTLLLKQSIISGIGNIYADEALWAAGIHPASNAKAIPSDTLWLLLSSAQEIMHAAIGAGGTSFDSLYVAVNGQSGKYSQKLKAYGRAGESCYRCSGILEKWMLNQRSTCFCSNCQKLYKYP